MFAGGFLNILLGRGNQIDDLCYLDEQLYKSLMNMKSFVQEGGDARSMDLRFEVCTGILCIARDSDDRLPVYRLNDMRMVRR